MADITSGLIAIALGSAVLLFGKDLRVFGAAAGFLIGFTITRQVVPEAFFGALIVATVPAIIIWLVLPIILLILVLVLGSTARLILQILGAVAGAAILLWLGQSLGLPAGVASWGAAFMGAVIGFGLMAHFFELGVIILASLLGASLIVNGLEAFIVLPSVVSILIALSLVVVGFLYQRRR